MLKLSSSNLNLLESLFNSGYLRAFCHLKPERSFTYEEHIQSILCHRCSAIYSGFLIFLVFLTILRWNGYWGKKKSKILSFFIAGLMVGLSVLQVGYEEYIAKAWFTENVWRFCVGVLTGFGIYQFMLLSEENNSHKKEIPLWVMILSSSVIIFTHYHIAHDSYTYAAITTLSGLMALYIIMNIYVLLSFFPKLKPKYFALIVAFMIACEWTFFYQYNTSSHG
jgi:uncharacterized membrane protein